MRFKKLAAVALSTALIFGGTTGVAHAQSAAPSPSSEIPIPPELVGFVTQFNVPADVAYAGLQIAAAWVGIGTGSPVLSSVVLSSVVHGSPVLSSVVSNSVVHGSPVLSSVVSSSVVHGSPVLSSVVSSSVVHS